jgi:hypothetical protein
VLDFAIMRQLAMRFRGILRGRNTEQLDGWLYDAHHSGVYAMQRFARTLQQDLGAVRNALTEPPCSDRPPPRLGEHTEAVVAALPQAGSGG